MTPKLTPKLAPLNAPPLDALSDLSSLSSGSDDEDDDAEAKAEEELHAVIDTFKHQMHQIYVASQAAQQQVGRLLTRAKEEATEVAVRPLRPRAALAAWLAARGLPADPSLEECMEACLDAAEARDLDTRTLLFSKADAAVLTGGQRRVTVFDMLRLIPALFE